MKRKLTIIAVILTATSLLAAIWCFTYPRLFPQRMLADQTKIHMMMLAGATSEAARFQHDWPASMQQLIAGHDPVGKPNLYLAGYTNDGWGRAIILEPFNSTKGYGRMISYGADGQPGGEGSANDLIMHYGENQNMSFVKRE